MRICPGNIPTVNPVRGCGQITSAIPVEGEGIFVYRAVHVLHSPFTGPSSPRPEWDVPVSEDASAYTHLEHGFCQRRRTAYRITVQRDKIGGVEWNHAIAATYAYMGNPGVSLLWSRAGEFGRWSSWSQIWDVDSKIRNTTSNSGLFTGAVHVVPAIIQKAYDEYCESMWENPERCDGFLYHFIGSTVQFGYLPRQPRKTGRLVLTRYWPGPRLRMPVALPQRLSSSIPALSGLAYRRYWP